jgi:hypothetical protein
MGTTSKIKVTVAAAIAAGLALAGCGGAARPTGGSGAPGATDHAAGQPTAAQIVAGTGNYQLYADVPSSNLRGPSPLLYASGHIANAATGVNTAGDAAELVLIARSPADAQFLDGELQPGVAAIDAAIPAPSAERIALIYLPHDPDRAAGAGPLSVMVIGGFAAVQTLVGNWSSSPSALLPPGS